MSRFRVDPHWNLWRHMKPKNYFNGERALRRSAIPVRKWLLHYHFCAKKCVFQKLWLEKSQKNPKDKFLKRNPKKSQLLKNLSRSRDKIPKLAMLSPVSDQSPISESRNNYQAVSFIVRFCLKNNPVRSDAYFPEWKPAFIPNLFRWGSENLEYSEQQSCLSYNSQTEPWSGHQSMPKFQDLYYAFHCDQFDIRRRPGYIILPYLIFLINN